MSRNPFKHSILGAAIALSLAACGGGGSGGGLVRSSPPPATPPPPASTGPCPAPITGDCIVTSASAMQGGRTSAGALIVDGASLILGGNAEPWTSSNVTYRFDAGTQIKAGASLNVTDGRTLVSEVTNTGGLSIWGTVQGNLVNTGWTELFGEVVGNLDNSGQLIAEGASYGNPMSIAGDFSQSSAGTLQFGLAPGGWDSPAALHVTGLAQLAGTFELGLYTDAWGPYSLPAIGAHHLLHADGGVFGTFDQWTAPGLFVDGSLRYGSNDVWFDLVRISLEAAAMSQGLGTSLTQASAGNLDRALLAADAFAANPTPAQQQFLASAARLLWMRDPAQATRALDALSGVEHGAVLRSATGGIAQQAALGAHLDGVRPGHAVGAWSRQDGAGTLAGVDQWLGPRLLAGVRTSQRAATNIGHAAGTDLSAGAYLRWFGNEGWYAGADAGVVRRTLGLGRTIDFGDAGRWSARSQRALDAVDISGEVGRTLTFGGGSLTPFAGAELGIVHGAASVEQGVSGFELALADATQHQLRAKAGLRYAHDWRFGNGAWLGLQASTGLERVMLSGGDPQQAAFTGVPDAWFVLPYAGQDSTRWTSLGLQGGWGRGWRWSTYRDSGAMAGAQQWRLLLRRDW